MGATLMERETSPVETESSMTRAIRSSGMNSRQIAAAYAVVAIVVGFGGRVFPGILSPYHSFILSTGMCYALLALPLNVLMGYAGQVSLGHAAFVGIGAFTSGIIAGRLGLPFLLGLLVAAIVGALAAMIIGLPALRIRGLYLALVTLGFGLAMREFVFGARVITHGHAGLSVPAPKVGNWIIDNTSSGMLGVVIGLFGLAWLLDRNILRTKVGRAFLALRVDEEVTAAAGVDVPRYKLLAFTLYGGLTAVGGSVFGHVGAFAQPETFIFSFSLFFVVVVLVGGLRYRTGAAAAGFLFGAFPRFFLFLKEAQFWIGPLLVMVTVVKHPGGMGQSFRDARELLTRRARTKNTETPDEPVRTSFVLPRPASTSPSNEIPLAVRDVMVRFGGLVAVDGVSFSVPEGKITGLIGPNGAGKTTLFNAISGLVKTERGEIVLDGTDVSRAPAHERARLGLGRTFQQIGLIKDVTVTDNLLFAQHRLAAYSPVTALLHTRTVARTEHEIRARAAETLAVLGFERFADSELGKLSHGQQRIVELASALLTAPRVLLLDEPSAGMSPAAAEALAERLIQIRDELGQTIVLIEHHLPLVLATCDSVNVMDAGKLLMSGTPGEIRSDPAVVAAYLGERPR